MQKIRTLLARLLVLAAAASALQTSVSATSFDTDGIWTCRSPACEDK